MCFMKEGKSDKAARSIKSNIMTKVIDFVLSVDTFEQKRVVLKGMLKSPQLKDHVHNIGIDPSLSKHAIYEHKCLKNIKTLYKQSGKCDNQKQLKDILEAVMAFTPERFTYNSHISPMTSTKVKKPSDLKSLCMFTNVL